MAFPDYERDLRDATVDVNFILDRYFHSGQSAVFAGASPEEEAELKEQVATELFRAFGTRVHPLQLVICGSAHLGFSPIPDRERFGRPFDPRRSDIDIAVISAELFETWWTELQSCGAGSGYAGGRLSRSFLGFHQPCKHPHHQPLR